MFFLDQLEAESIYILREVVAETQNPVMLYSIGKDSSVMLHLAKKAFYPSKIPFKILHVDTGWKFKEMYSFRDKVASMFSLDLVVYKNIDGFNKKINPFDYDSSYYTNIMKTDALKQALNEGDFDVAFIGARRDEEKSRAKERIFSFRSESHQWDPKNQRPELWNLYNTKLNKGESIRVFPLSNWTEIDIWEYIHKEKIDVVPLYFSKVRPTVFREGSLLMIDDNRMPIKTDEKIENKNIRFRTLGCYPLTAAITSRANNTPEIIKELLIDKQSERSGRIIDHDNNFSMEQKKN
jgi:sulfate adenylyltransferase subunit 2